MRSLQSKSRSISIGEAFITDRGFRDDDEAAAKILIKKANSVNILSIFKKCSLKIDEYAKKAHCPFPHHNDKSASFYYYKDTNSFYCFGCKSGGGPVEFVSLIGSIDKREAAEKIVSKFEADINLELSCDTKDFAARQQMFLEFSTLIRNFIHSNSDDDAAIHYCEKLSLIFDTINIKHNIDNEGLKSLIAKLKIKLGQYRAQ